MSNKKKSAYQSINLFNQSINQSINQSGRIVVPLRNLFICMPQNKSLRYIHDDDNDDDVDEDDDIKSKNNFYCFDDAQLVFPLFPLFLLSVPYRLMEGRMDGWKESLGF